MPTPISEHVSARYLLNDFCRVLILDAGETKNALTIHILVVHLNKLKSNSRSESSSGLSIAI